ncbi:MAG TPA: AEC family transporter [Spirochaetota bacterium]|nr:AEC family transporter [Spirochaetota bacterium]
MEDILIVLSKIFYIVILFASGIIAKKFRLLSDKGEEDLSKIFTDFFWPALIFFSITSKLNRADIVDNVSLPFLAVLTGLVGFLFGFLFIKIFKFKDDERKIFLFHSVFNNFSFMVLPFAVMFLPEKGAGLLFISNTGFIVLIWTLGVFILNATSTKRDMLLKLLSPGLIVTVLSIVIVLADVNKFIPQMFFDITETLGSPTIPIAMMITGARIYKLGVKSLKFNFWNITLGILRLVLIPAVLFFTGLFFKNVVRLNKEVLIIFMLVNIMPVSVNSVTMAISYKSNADLASEGVVFTHLFSIITVTIYVILIRKFFV